MTEYTHIGVWEGEKKNKKKKKGEFEAIYEN